MKIDFGAVIRDIRGEPVGEGEKKLTLGAVACQALLGTYGDEKNITAQEKVQRFTLAALCSNDGEAEISAEDVVRLKGLIGKAYGPLVVGRAYELIGS